MASVGLLVPLPPKKPGRVTAIFEGRFDSVFILRKGRKVQQDPRSLRLAADEVRLVLWRVSDVRVQESAQASGASRMRCDTPLLQIRPKRSRSRFPQMRADRVASSPLLARARTGNQGVTGRYPEIEEKDRASWLDIIAASAGSNTAPVANGQTANIS